MNLFIYSDESGVFDKRYNEKFAFGWLIFKEKEEKDIAVRKYKAKERQIRESYSEDMEIKANHIRRRHRNKLFKSLKDYERGAIVINQSEVLDNIFEDKKVKQRYLDYAYKVGVKKHLKDLMRLKIIYSEEIKNIYFYIDEHNTATNGIYELRESLFQEFKYGTYNKDWEVHYPALLPELNDLQVYFCSSKTTPLVRAADLVVNRVYNHAIEKSLEELKEKVFLSWLP
ncbi:MAG: DUF3800 domain-containing protein [Lactovum sp.]